VLCAWVTDAEAASKTLKKKLVSFIYYSPIKISC